MKLELKLRSKTQSEIIVNAKYIAYGTYSHVFSFVFNSEEYVVKIHSDWDLNELGIVTELRHPNLVRAEWFFFDYLHEQILQYYTNTSLDSPDAERRCSNLECTKNLKQLCVVYKKYTPLNCVNWKKVSYNVKYTLILDIITGLSYIHNLGMYHGDIKPSNILVCKNSYGEYSRAMLADFSLCYPEQIHTKLNGSIGYSSPETTEDLTFLEDSECANGGGQVSDIWSLACVILYVLTQKEPFVQFLDSKIPECNINAYFDIQTNISDFILKLLETGPDHKHIDNFEFWFKILRVTFEFESTKRYTNLSKIIKYISNKFELPMYSISLPQRNASVSNNFDSEHMFIQYFNKLVESCRTHCEHIIVPEKYIKYFLHGSEFYPETFKKLCQIVDTCTLLLEKYPGVCPKSLIITTATMIGLINSRDNYDTIQGVVQGLNGHMWGLLPRVHSRSD